MNEDIDFIYCAGVWIKSQKNNSNMPLLVRINTLRTESPSIYFYGWIPNYYSETKSKLVQKKHPDIVFLD